MKRRSESRRTKWYGTLIEFTRQQQRRNQEESYSKQKGVDHKALRKQVVQKKLVDSKVSTASLGKFDKKLDKDNIKIKGSKRKVIIHRNTYPIGIDSKIC